VLERVRQDPVKWILWAIIAVGVVWGLFFVNDGPQFVLNGVRLGAILMLGAIGLSLTFKILNFANFSHGDLLIFGAYVAMSADFFLVDWLPRIFPALGDNGELLRWIAIGIAIVIGAVGGVLLAVLIDRVLYSRMRRSAAVVLVIASFGMALFIRALIQAIWGVSNQRYAMRIRPPVTFDVGIGEVKITTIQLVTVIVAFALVILLHLFLKYTRIGKAMRAMSDNADLAKASGVNTEAMVRWTWALGAGLASIGGVFMGLNFGIINPNTGLQVLLPLFAAVILGGIGSPYGAMLGALVIGFAQNILVAPVTSINSSYKPGIAFLIMILMLLVRPQGLLGEPERKG
jgi:branched-chain amino acid transport system permease protein/neutral amino acid transport system permease protein